MAVKTKFSEEELVEILSNYDLGELVSFEPISKGTIQTNYFLKTANGKFVFRYYENRSERSVFFEANLIKYLRDKEYPCPTPIKNRHGKLVGTHNGKPYVIFEFVEGYNVDNPNERQREQLIQKVAQLQNVTKDYRAANKRDRWNYTPELAKELARKAASRLNTHTSREKLAWFEEQLATLKLPKSLPKGICHCDFDVSNVLFGDSKFRALLESPIDGAADFATKFWRENRKEMPMYSLPAIHGGLLKSESQRLLREYIELGSNRSLVELSKTLVTL